jgi:hypothetical protein
VSDDLQTQPWAELPGEPNKPWYRRWWAITIGGLFVLLMIGGIFGDDTDYTVPSDEPTVEATSASPEPEPTEQIAPPEPKPPDSTMKATTTAAPSSPAEPPPPPPESKPLSNRHHPLSRPMNATRRTTPAFVSPVTSTAKAEVETARPTQDVSVSLGRMNTT